MAYQVLARKWRPKNFTELVGQNHVQKALLNALEKQQLHHAYLFTGTRGVGKTTIARILAKCLNCETGITTNPCGECGSCREIAEGRFPDLLEVDAASRTKVEDTRELLDNVQYAPVRGRYKVYLIDEVHMLSTHSFNALLKTLEEPPPHVKFLLATTDPQKLPATVLSRCLQFHLKNMSPENIVAHLQHVLTQETIEFEDAALWQLANAAEGSMRDAMSLTDQAIAFGAGKIIDADVRDMLGTIDRSSAWQLLQWLTQSDSQALFDNVESLAQLSTDFSAMLDALIHCLHVLMRHQILPNATAQDGDRAITETLAASTNPEQLQLLYQIALNARKDIGFAPTARIGFEVALMRMLSFQPLALNQQIASAPQLPVEAPQEVTPAKKPERSADAPPPVVDEEPPHHVLQDIHASLASQSQVPAAVEETPAAAPATVATAVPAVEKRLPNERTAQAMFDAAVPETVAEQPKKSDAQTASQPTTRAVLIPETDNVTEKWLLLCPQLPINGVVKSIANHCELRSIKGSRWYLALDPVQEAVYDERYRKALEDTMQAALSTQLAEGFKLFIDITAGVENTPAKHAARIAKQQHEQALQSLTEDPVVQLLVNECGGILRPDTVKMLPPQTD